MVSGIGPVRLYKAAECSWGKLMQVHPDDAGTSRLMQVRPVYQVLATKLWNRDTVIADYLDSRSSSDVVDCPGVAAHQTRY
jgi:hypothetical protein